VQHFGRIGACLCLRNEYPGKIHGGLYLARFCLLYTTSVHWLRANLGQKSLAEMQRLTGLGRLFLVRPSLNNRILRSCLKLRHPFT
jgi:hypothetical protein